MRRLELTDDEARELAVALEEHVHGLRVELTSTDARDFRAGLRERLETLERVTARLADSQEPARRQT